MSEAFSKNVLRAYNCGTCNLEFDGNFEFGCFTILDIFIFILCSILPLGASQKPNLLSSVINLM